MDWNIEVEDITEDFLRENDGKIAWIRDDYLMLAGYTSDPKTLKILRHVQKLKSKMIKDGYKFSA